MKTLKYLSFLLFAFVLSVGFASCSDDDESIDPAAIVGKWEAVWSEGYEIDDEEPEYNDRWSEEVGGEFVTFEADGSGYYQNNTQEFSWKLEGNQLMIDERYSTEVYTVVKLNASEMVLEYYEKEDSYEYYDKTTCRKVE